MTRLLLILSEPWLQIALLLLIAFLSFTLAAVIQKRLTRLTIWLLAAVLVLSAVSSVRYGFSPIYRQIAGQSGQDSLVLLRAALERTDTRTAWLAAQTALHERPEQPEPILLSARTALVSGDLPAADHYYSCLSLNAARWSGQMQDWPVIEQELTAWQSLAALPAAGRIDKARQLAETVLDQVLKENQSIPAVVSQTQLAAQLDTIRDTLAHLKTSDASDESWQALSQSITTLHSQQQDKAVTTLLADVYLAMDQDEALVDMLQTGSSLDQLHLANLIVTGQVALDQLPEEASESSYLTGLADELESRARKETSLAPELLLAAVELCWTEALSDHDQAGQLINTAATRYPNGSGLKSLDRLIHLSEILQDAEHAYWQTETISEPITADENNLAGLLSDGADKADRPSKPGLPTGAPSPTPLPTPTPAPPWPNELASSRIRQDFQPLFNLCTPEMTQDGLISFFVTLAGGSQGYPGGVPDAQDFEFRTNVGFRHLLNVQSFTEVAANRYTLLILDNRPFIPAETLELQQQAAQAFVRSMADGEQALVVIGGLPYQGVRSVADDGEVLVFGNSDMTCHKPTADKAALEQFIQSVYGGDAFSSPDLISMITWPVSNMTAVDPDSVSGTWEQTALNDVSPWLGQVIVFTNGDPDGGVSAGGDQSPEYLRGAAIAANTAIHFVNIQSVRDQESMQHLASAGRGELIDPSVDDLMAFYSYIRERPFKVFLATCSIPEYPVSSFFELWGHHLPTGVYAGFLRNPGKGMDLVGASHYSDAGLSNLDFADYTGSFGEDGPLSGDDWSGPDFDPFEDPDTGADLGFDGSVTDFAEGDLAVYPPDQHAIARSMSGMVLISLPGSGFSGLQPAQVNLTIPGVGRINPAYISIEGDNVIRFFLPVNLPAGLYTLNVVIGDRPFSFPDTFLLYDVDGATTVTFGPWTISSAGMAPADDDTGDWVLTGACINDMVRFTDEIRLSDSWLSASADELAVTPLGDAYLSFDEDSNSLFVTEFFLEEGAVLQLGHWNGVTLTRAGDGAAFSSRQWQDIPARPLSFGLFDFPFDTGTLLPDRVEIPVMELNLDIPFQEYLLMSAGMKKFAATSSALVTARRDDLDLFFEASVSAGVQSLKGFGALGIKGIKLEIDTAESRVSLGIEAKLIQDKCIRATVAIKGVVFDELAFSMDVEIPVTQTPVPVTLTELGGGVRDLADAFSGDPLDILGATIFGTAKLEAGNVLDYMRFLKDISWLKENAPPLLATDNTELSLRPWPFSLAFETDLALFDAFSIGHAELSLGFYAFNQSLLGIQDDDAVGLHALLLIGPDLDLSVVRIGYNTGPSIDINNHGFFMQMQGGAWAGVNLGFVEFTMDMTGKFLIAIHDIPDSSWPQLAIVMNAVPSVAIPGLWDTDDELDIRLLINESGVRLIGIPMQIDIGQTINWLENQVTAAATQSWEAVTDGMDALSDAADATWDYLSDTGEMVYDATVDVITEGLSNGTGLLIQTGSTAIDIVDGLTGGQLSGLLNQAEEDPGIVGSAYTGVVGFFSG
ncbi:MAG: hypothetical protein SCM11_08185 [Bacillota bacterium]|nr:hypothetical protein [Bacillota bacterium]